MAFDPPIPQYREYAVPYTSTSKGESFCINDPVKFNDFHLTAAVAKIRKQLVGGGAMTEHEFDVLEALCRECGYRDLNPAYKGGKTPTDPRVPVRPGGDNQAEISTDADAPW